MAHNNRASVCVHEDTGITWLLLLVGLVPVLGTLTQKLPWSFDASFGLLMVLFAMRQLVDSSTTGGEQS